ncbi:BTAD domain-containing putative transcriptional regulator [Nocardia sp. NPDC051030]|uniref:BTAD domain-containing putative transcriptional regulator n=1 Tax=Nocardia sp. NPDC051030 TaxID=3155162 RepID=UPI003444D7CD
MKILFGLVQKWVWGRHDTMAVTRIGVLGPLHISIDGRRVPPGAPMQCAVLGRLVAANGRVVPTDRLIDDLWHGAPPTKAVAALQVYIHNLRRVFEPDRPRRARSRVIVSESHGYALNLEPGQVDAWQFEQLLHGHEAAMRDPAGRPDPIEQVRVLDAALACWHGNAFESFTGMPWAAQEAARLAALRLTAAELRAQAALEMNRPAEVVLALRPIFEEHPGREECARLLALAQYRLGQSLDALVTVRRSREFLTHEFGVDPGPGLRDLETAILTHSVESETASVPAFVRTAQSTPAPEPDPLPDNGYAVQRDAVLSAAESAAAGHMRLVWLAGEAGAGKTTLAAAITTHLAERGWSIVFGRCPEVEDAPPAWAWAEVLTGLDAADPETFTAADAFTLARRVVRSCRERSASTPIIIVLEDVHGADTATLQVLRQVVNWLRDRPILIVATLRGTEAGPGVRDTAAALAQFTADRIELDGLDLAGTRQAAAAAGLTQLDDRTVELLRRRTGGNPLFVRELAKLVASQGTTDGLPDSVRDLLGRRIGQLPDEVIELLRHMSVGGEDSDVSTLAAFTGHTADMVIDLVAAAEAARLLCAEGSGRITFDHALVRETVYYGIPVLRRARMHWAAFELLSSAGPTNTPPSLPAVPRGRDIDTLAHHAALGASPETALLALEFVRAAAEQCVERRMRADAVRRWRSVLSLHELAGHIAPPATRSDRAAARESAGDLSTIAVRTDWTLREPGRDAAATGMQPGSMVRGSGADMELEVRAGLVELLVARCELVTALAYDGQHVAARAHREEALALAEYLGGTELLAQAVTCWPTPLIWSVHDWHTPDPGIREPLRIALGDPELADTTRVRLQVTSVFDCALDDPATARLAAKAAATLAESIDDPDLLCTAINAQAFAAFAAGGFLRAEELKQYAVRLLRVSAAAELTEFQALAHYLLFRAALADADLVAADEHGRSASEYATDGQLRHLLDAIAPFGLVLELLRGSPDQVLRLLDAGPVNAGDVVARAEADAEELSRDPNALHVGIAVSIGWMRRDMSPYVEELRQRNAVKPELFVYGYALGLVDSGRLGEARRVLAEAPPLGPQFWSTFTAVRGRLAIALGDLAGARLIYDELLPYAGTICGLETGAASLGPMDYVLADLANALGQPERAAEHRAAAERLHARIQDDLARLSSSGTVLLDPAKLGPAGQSRLVRLD